MSLRIDEAIATAKAAIAAREAREAPKGQKHPMPEKDVAWQAYCAMCMDEEQSIDRDDFERWWAARDKA